MRKTERQELNIFDLFKLFWEKKLLIAMIGLLLALLFLLASVTLVSPLYKSRALMYVNSSDISLAGTKVNISASDLSAAKSLVETYIVILETPETLREVIEKTGVSYTYEQLLKMIDADAVNGTEVFYIEVTSPSPDEAQLLVNTIAQVIPDRIASIVEGSSARIVAQGLFPTKKASPNLTKNTIIGFLLGVFLCSGGLVVWSIRDDTIRDESYLINTYQYPLLASIPNPNAESSGGWRYGLAQNRRGTDG